MTWILIPCPSLYEPESDDQRRQLIEHISAGIPRINLNPMTKDRQLIEHIGAGVPHINLNPMTKDRQLIEHIGAGVPHINLNLMTKDRQLIEHIGAGAPRINLNLMMPNNVISKYDFSGREPYLSFTNGSYTLTTTPMKEALRIFGKNLTQVHCLPMFSIRRL
ncbi:hypothetical protein M1B74_03730 [Bacteroides pyogenes]|uniref:hypothetical protein n=1 Tax=Bacteroides pyogenes TaxID=310300 RepID=UPI003B4399A3